MKQSIPDLQQLNWALEKVTKIPRTPSQPLTEEDIKTLRSGQYTNSQGDTITFGLPDIWNITTALDRLAKTD